MAHGKIGSTREKGRGSPSLDVARWSIACTHDASSVEILWRLRRGGTIGGIGWRGDLMGSLRD